MVAVPAPSVTPGVLLLSLLICHEWWKVRVVITTKENIHTRVVEIPGITLNIKQHKRYSNKNRGIEMN